MRLIILIASDGLVVYHFGVWQSLLHVVVGACEVRLVDAYVAAYGPVGVGERV